MGGGAALQEAIYYQNNVAALCALDLLKPAGRLVSLELDNPEHAKHIDDVILHYADRDEFIQVKWKADDNTRLTIHSLVASEEDGLCLLAKLAKGFMSLSDRSRSTIVLLSTRKLSNRKSPSAGLPNGLTSFIADVLDPLQEEGLADNCRIQDAFPEYSATLGTLAEASGLAEEEFVSLLSCLTFRLSQPTRSEVQREVRLTLSELGVGADYYETLVTAVVEWSISGETVTREVVLEKLGVLDRFLDPLEHSYPVDEREFVETEDLFRALDDALHSLPGGPILVEGPPGIGKSTALTVYRRRVPDMTVGYYCYVPDEPTFGSVRLERDSLVQSLCVGLQRAFPDLGFPAPYSPASVKKLREMLLAVSASHKRALLVIDGLDHVYGKAAQLDAPLLEILDGSLPSNVFMVLSSQSIEVLPVGLRDRIRSCSKRHILLHEMSLSQCRDFAKKQGLALDRRSLQLLYQKSEGVPLYIHYVCNQLSVTAREAWGELIGELPALADRTIREYHDWLLAGLDDQPLSMWVLRILACRNEYTTADALVQLLGILDVRTDHIEVDVALKRVAHLLKFSDAKGVAIFHNSLREGILAREPRLLARLNGAIAEYYALNPVSDEAFRNRYRHLLALGHFREILDDCNEEWLRVRWDHFRPLSETDSNLDLAWRAAIGRHELLEFTRIGLMLQGTSLIRQNLELCDCSIARVLLASGLRSEALRHVWDGRSVRAEADEFFHFVLEFRGRTGHLLPREIFLAALDQLPKPSSEDDTCVFFQACALYWPWDQVADQIRSIQWGKPTHHEDRIELSSDAEILRTNQRVMNAAVEKLAEFREWEKLLSVAASVLSYPCSAALAKAEAACLLLEAGEVDEGITQLRAVDSSTLPDSVVARFVVNLVDAGRLQDLNEEARIHDPDLSAPLVKDLGSGVRTEVFGLYNSLRASLALDSSSRDRFRVAVDALANPERDVYGALLSLAELWAASRRTSLAEGTKAAALRNVLTKLNLPPAELNGSVRFQGGYIRQSIWRIYSDVFEFAAKNLGTKALDSFVDFWLKLDRDRGGYRSVDTHVEVAGLLCDLIAGAAKSLAKGLLGRAEELARLEEDKTLLTQELLKCMRGWGRCGFQGEARRVWRDVYDLACGPSSHKDYQFHSIIGALRRAHEANPTETPRRLLHLLERSHQLEASTGGAPAATAIEELIRVAALVAPEWAFQLLDVEDDHIARERALSSILSDLVEREEMPLRFAWAVALTMDRSDDLGSFRQHTYRALRTIHQAAVASGEDALSDEILNQCRLFLELETGHSQLLGASGSLLDVSILDEKHSSGTYGGGQDEAEARLQNILGRVAECSLNDLDRCEQEARQDLDGRQLSKALLGLAHRHSKLRPDRAADLLDDSWKANRGLAFLVGEEWKSEFFRFYFSVNPSRARDLLLEGFRQLYYRYPREIIRKLDLLFEFAGFFTDSPSHDQSYELFAAYADRLARGLPAFAKKSPTLDPHAEGRSSRVAAVEYIARLFQYPEVHIRKQALSSLYWLAGEEPSVIDSVAAYCDGLSVGAREHAVVLIAACTVRDPGGLARQKPTLMKWLAEKHFNLRQSIKELLLEGTHRTNLLTEEELEVTRRINRPPSIIVSRPISMPSSNVCRFVPSSHLTGLLYKLHEVAGIDDIVERVLMELSTVGWDPSSGREIAQRAHRRHNINTNFDPIELMDPYSQAILDATNRVLVEAIAAGEVSDDAIRDVSCFFRQYDPSMVTRHVARRPPRLDWLSRSHSDESFLEFDGVEELADLMVHFEAEHLVLYQDSHQRLLDQYRVPSRRTYSRIAAFAVADALLGKPDEVLPLLSPLPMASTQNAYRLELPTVFPSSASFPTDGVSPVIGVSFNRFRGHSDLSIASLLPDVVSELGLACNGPEPVTFEGGSIRLIEWIEPYDQGRRRQLPLSTGVALLGSPDLLDRWLEPRGMGLAWFGELYRSTDRYKREEDMSWRSCRFVVCGGVALEIKDAQYGGVDFVES